MNVSAPIVISNAGGTGEWLGAGAGLMAADNVAVNIGPGCICLGR
jgi:hypothetical protein